MQRYGKIINEELLTRDRMSQGYKPLVYGEIPEDFYEETHFLVEKDPEEFEDYIFIGYEAVELKIEIDEESEMTLEEVKAGIEEKKKEYLAGKIEEPDKLEALQQTVDSIFTEVLPMFFE